MKKVTTKTPMIQDCIVFYERVLDRRFWYKMYFTATGADVAFRHACAIIDHKGIPIIFECNTSPSYSGPFHTIHAEHAAILALQRKGLYDKAHKYTLVVIRVSGCSLLSQQQKKKKTYCEQEHTHDMMCVNFGNSKPCTECQKKIDKAGFKNVIYSTSRN